MVHATDPATARPEPELVGQTVVLIGGSAGIGLETARRARAEGADGGIAARDSRRLEQAALELGARNRSAFDATDADALERFFNELPAPVDHVLVTAAGAYYAPLAEIDLAQAQRQAEDHLWLPIRVARHAVGKVRAGGTLLFVGGTAARPAVGSTIAGALAAAE